jgi:hypothetical protein
MVEWHPCIPLAIAGPRSDVDQYLLSFEWEVITGQNPSSAIMPPGLRALYLEEDWKHTEGYATDTNPFLKISTCRKDKRGDKAFSISRARTVTKLENEHRVSSSGVCREPLRADP